MCRGLCYPLAPPHASHPAINHSYVSDFGNDDDNGGGGGGGSSPYLLYGIGLTRAALVPAAVTDDGGDAKFRRRNFGDAKRGARAGSDDPGRRARWRETHHGGRSC
jgi:hypothetical protein